MTRHSGERMTFVMQLELPPPFQVGGHRMAYLFMEDDVDAEIYPCEAEGGRNAVILQGGPAFEPHVMVSNAATGPALGSHDSPVEGPIVIAPAKAGEVFPGFPIMGGEPEWLQVDETPTHGPWRLLLQVDSEHVPCTVPYEACLYVFVSPNGERARMLYQFT